MCVPPDEPLLRRRVLWLPDRRCRSDGRPDTGVCFFGGVVFRRRCRRFHIVAFSQSEPSSSVVPLSPVVMFVLYVCHVSGSWFSVLVQASPLSSLMTIVRRRVEMDRT